MCGLPFAFSIHLVKHGNFLATVMILKCIILNFSFKRKTYNFEVNNNNFINLSEYHQAQLLMFFDVHAL